MAKEPGKTRIPLPSSLRPPTVSNNFNKTTTLKQTQIFRPPNAISKSHQYQQQQRPTSLSGIRPPLQSVVGVTALKKSSSGERINNAVNMLSKRTKTAFKNYFGKTEKKSAQSPQPQIEQQQQQHQQIGEKRNDSRAIEIGNDESLAFTKIMQQSTPRPLARSETFVRSESQVDMLGITPPNRNIQANSGGGGGNRPSVLCTTRSMDATANWNETMHFGLQRTHNLDSTHISAIGFGETIDMNDMNSPGATAMSPVSVAHALGNTICVEKSLSVTQTLPTHNKNPMNVTHTKHELFGKTMTVQSPSECVQQHFGTTMPLTAPNLTKTLNSTELLDKFNGDAQATYTELGSPAPTNATYSNPGSVDSLQLLEHISMPAECASMEKPQMLLTNENLLELSKSDQMDQTLTVLAPDKTNMKLTLNSTVNTERLLDLTDDLHSPARHMQLLNLTKYYTPYGGANKQANTTNLLYMTPQSATTTPDRQTKLTPGRCGILQHTPMPMLNQHHQQQYQEQLYQSPMLLKGAQSDLVLPIRTPDDELLHMAGEPMDVDTTLTSIGVRTEQFFAKQQHQYHQQQQHQHQQPQLLNGAAAVSLQDVNDPNVKQKTRFSFGLDLTDSTLDCSIELVDNSLSSTQQTNASSLIGVNNMSQSPSAQQLQQQLLKKQNSFEMDDSLGILTPDQMKEFLDSTNTNNTNNLELPLIQSNNHNHSNNNHNKLNIQQMRFDQTPSPEELPLDPVGLKTDISEMVLSQHQLQQQQQQQLHFLQRQQHLPPHQQQQLQQQSSSTAETLSLHTDTEHSKAEQLTSKSSVSKICTSFITSVTSVTSLDTGYQGDGEMSRPASRGACDHSPSNGPAARKIGVSRHPNFNQQQYQLQQQHQLPPIRRQDPMTDSDFFTESDADDMLHRGDRRAQVIDGQLYGPTMQPTASVFISEDPQMEDSCMESSGIFTDVENRCDEDPALMRRQDTQDAIDMSPDAEDSTETVKSNREKSSQRRTATTSTHESEKSECGGSNALGQGQLSCSQTSSTIQSSFSNDRLSAATTLSNRTSYCSVDGSGVNVDCKSFSSLDEAFADRDNNEHIVGSGVKRTKSTTSGNLICSEQQLPVQRDSSTRKHASLTSLLCNTTTTTTINGAKITCRETFVPAFSFDQNGVRSNDSESGTGSKVSLSDSLKSSVASVTRKNTITPSRNKNQTTPKSATKKQRASPATPINSKQQHNGSGGSVRKSPSPNKWDAVMNKIASNKTILKTNFNDVKSKVSTTRVNVSANMAGVSLAPSPNTPTAPTTVRRSPSSANRSGSASPASHFVKIAKSKPQDTGSNGVSGQQSLSTKRVLQNATVKRGRSFSKDSQKSSQSDLSLMSGSPKLLAKTPLRAAKKRDVRNLSISPTDLGPPSKTQQTANGATVRTKPTTTVILTQKRGTISSVTSGSRSSPSTISTTASIQSTGSAVGDDAVAIVVRNKNNNGNNGINVKSSTPAKKLNSNTGRRLELKTTPSPKSITTTTTVPATVITSSPTTAKTSLKEQIRLQQSTIAATTTTTTTTTNKIGGKPELSTQLLELDLKQNNNNSHNNNNDIHRKNSTANSSLRTSPLSASPLPTNLQNVKKSATTNINGTPLEKKLQNKLPNSVARKSLLQNNYKQQQPPQQCSSVDESTNTTNNSFDLNELEQLKLLQRHSCNGRLDFNALEQHLHNAESKMERQDKSVEVLSVMVQYMAFELDAFVCPSLKRENAKAKENLSKTLQLLDEAKNACTELQDQICDKEAYFTQREEELQALHRCELEKALSNQNELQMLLQQRKIELDAKDIEHKRVLDCYRLEMENKLALKSQNLRAAEEQIVKLRESLQFADSAHIEMRETLTRTEHECAARLQASAVREEAQNERIKVLNRELDILRDTKEHNERKLREQLNLTQDEIEVLRTSQRSLSESTSSPRNSSSSASAVTHITELQRLQSEAESLRCVLELKQKEISKLNKQNEELMRDADERATLVGKVSLLESRHELLQSELDIKSAKEKDLLRQIEEIRKAQHHEFVKRQRLSYDNEELKWTLKQRSEQLHLIESKLHDLSAHDTILNISNAVASSSMVGSAPNSINRSFSQQNGSTSNISMNGSPPTSPIVKGVIKKSESVSWVLEMDDETPEAAASKMVKRAGSYRTTGNGAERSPTQRRQLSVSANAVPSSNATPNAGLIPLSQSASATSLTHHNHNNHHHHHNHHSSEQSSLDYRNHHHTHPRMRSQSVCLKNCDNVVAAATASGACANTNGTRRSSTSASIQLPAWKEPICSSSPYNSGLRPRTSTMKSAATAAAGAATPKGTKTAPTTTSGTFAEHIETMELFCNNPMSTSGMSATGGNATTKLITCDTSTLNSGERLDMHALPTHPSVQDLKALKKFHEIQESAGEAMVSGTNSEDESCSASSDDLINLRSNSTTSSSLTSNSNSSAKQINSNISFEEVLLLNKIDSLTGTPMEVSWSEDVEVFGDGSAA